MKVCFYQIVYDNSTRLVVTTLVVIIIFQPFLVACFRVVMIITVPVFPFFTITIFIIVQFVFYFYVLCDELQAFMMIVIMKHFVVLIT